jgi:hypothetical protein
MSQLAAGPGRGVHVCPADPQHSQDPRCGCTSNECSSEVEQSNVSGTPPTAGVSWWTHGVPCFLLRRLGKRASLSARGVRFSWLGEAVRAQHRAAGVVLGGCDG